MGLLRYIKGDKTEEKSIITEMISKIELDEYQRIYLERRIPNVLNDDFDLISIKNKIAFQFFRFLALVCGILVPVCANFNDSFSILNLDKNFWVTLLGIISALSFGFLQTFQNEKVWLHHREMYEVLRTETFKFLSLSEKYSTFETHKKAFSKFTEFMEENIKTDIKNYTSIIEAREQSTKSISP